jgi:hypothetical protein
LGNDEQWQIIQITLTNIPPLPLFRRSCTQNLILFGFLIGLPTTSANGPTNRIQEALQIDLSHTMPCAKQGMVCGALLAAKRKRTSRSTSVCSLFTIHRLSQNMHTCRNDTHCKQDLIEADRQCLCRMLNPSCLQQLLGQPGPTAMNQSAPTYSAQAIAKWRRVL